MDGSEDATVSTKRDELLTRVQKHIRALVHFLSDYLPLANASTADFITENLWEALVCPSFREALLNLSYDELLELPFLTSDEFLYDNQEDTAAEKTSISFQVQNSSCKGFFFYSEKTPKVSEVKKIPSNSSIAVHCQSGKSLRSFVQQARNLSLENSDILTSWDSFQEKFLAPEDCSVFISNFMSQKKSHEVYIMASVCSSLSKRFGSGVVVDLGSGKGYLGTQLAYSHGLHVFGLDAVDGNTAGALKRARILRKQWSGLVKQKERQSKKNRSSEDCREREKVFPLNTWHQNPNKHEWKLTENKSLRDELSGVPQLFTDGDCEHEPKGLVIKTEQNVSSVELSLNQVLENCVESKKLLSSINVTAQGCSKFKSFDNKDLNNELRDDKNISCNAVLEGGKYIPVTTYIDSRTSLSTLVSSLHSQCRQDGDEEKILLTGLHTCGNLVATALQCFITDPSVSVVCNVGCCYHLLEEEFVRNPFLDDGDSSSETWGFPLSSFLRELKFGIGQAARNLACQSVHRNIRNHKLQGKAMFPRVLLQVMVKDLLGYTFNNKKGLRKLDRHCSSMYEYIRKGFQKLELSTDLLTDSVIDHYITKYKDEEQKLAAFFQLKLVLAPCVEALILLDRWCFLLEQDNVSQAVLVQLFNPVTSPRCYGIIAVKS